MRDMVDVVLFSSLAQRKTKGEWFVWMTGLVCRDGSLAEMISIVGKFKQIETTQL